MYISSNTCGYLPTFQNQIYVLVDFLLPVEQILPGHPDVAEGELGVVDPVEPHLVAHVLHEHAGQDLQLVVPDRH